MTPATLRFTALAAEYCALLEGATSQTPASFVAETLRMLPRIYICADDLLRAQRNAITTIDDAYLNPALDEDYYEAIRRGVETLLGPDDTFLEVFEQDMKYSETPIGASISEGLADIYQEMFNFTAMVQDAPDDIVDMAVSALVDDYEQYWSQTLVNVLRPLNALRNTLADEEE